MVAKIASEAYGDISTTLQNLSISNKQHLPKIYLVLNISNSKLEKFKINPKYCRLILTEYLVPISQADRDLFFGQNIDPRKDNSVVPSYVYEQIDDAFIANFIKEASDEDNIEAVKEAILKVKEFFKRSRFTYKDLYVHSSTVYNDVYSIIKPYHFDVNTRELFMNIVRLVQGKLVPESIEDNTMHSIVDTPSEVQSLINCLKELEKAGVNYYDLHSDNIMKRPYTNEFVIADPGLFE